MTSSRILFALCLATACSPSSPSPSTPSGSDAGNGEPDAGSVLAPPIGPNQVIAMGTRVVEQMTAASNGTEIGILFASRDEGGVRIELLTLGIHGEDRGPAITLQQSVSGGAFTELTPGSLIWDGEAWAASWPFDEGTSPPTTREQVFVRVKDGEVIARTREPMSGYLFHAWLRRSSTGITRLNCATTFGTIDRIALDGTVTSSAEFSGPGYTCVAVAPIDGGFAIVGRAGAHQFTTLSDDGVQSEMVKLPLMPDDLPQVPVHSIAVDGDGYRLLWMRPLDDEARRASLVLSRLRADGTLDGDGVTLEEDAGWWSRAGHVVMRSGVPVVAWSAAFDGEGGYNSTVHARRPGSELCTISDVTMNLDFEVSHVTLVPGDGDESVALWLDARQYPHRMGGDSAKNQIILQRIGTGCPVFQ